MLVTPELNRHNKRLALLLAAIVMLVCGTASVVYSWVFPMVLLGPLAYWLVRRRTLRRLRVMRTPFPPVWDAILCTQVAYFNALDQTDKDRFRQLVKIFLDEVRITGIRTEVDQQCRVLVAASAIIPVFGFPDWEYSGLGEVLIYPSAFGPNYGTSEQTDRTILGMVGTGHLSGVMVLSKPDLVAGFTNLRDKRNVGIHEFAHLVDKADGVIDGIPAGIPRDVARPWIEWIGQELDEPPKRGSHIHRYAYTNEAEYFAVLTEYLFEAPAALERKNPEMYRMLQKMFRQDTKRFLTSTALRRTGKVGRNTPCPCGSGEKYKKCCRLKALQGLST